MLNRVLNFGRRKLWYALNKVRFRNLGYNSWFISPLKLTPKYISCGQRVFVFKQCRIEGISSYNEATFNPEIVLKDDVSIQQNLHLTCAQSVVIGEYVAIAANVTITDIHHGYKDIETPIEKQDIEVQPVSIGEHSKIYNNAVILPGTKIGKHVTVAANSVVSGKFPDFCVIGGAPAKILRQYNRETGVWERQT